MQKNKTKTNKLALSHLKLASIYLSDLEYQKAIHFAKESIHCFEEYEKEVKSRGIFN